MTGNGSRVERYTGPTGKTHVVQVLGSEISAGAGTLPGGQPGFPGVIFSDCFLHWQFRRPPGRTQQAVEWSHGIPDSVQLNGPLW